MKRGFSLSEVLIAIGIIGVVAAMTIPTVINKYKEREIVSKVKKIYSTMNQAFLLSVKDNGYANEWDIGNGFNATTAQQIASYFKPYLKLVKDCGTSKGCLGYTEKMKTLDGNNQKGNYDTDVAYYKIILNDGSYIWMRGVSSYCQYRDGGLADTCGAIFFDINGGKQPNTIGKDIFVLYITPFAIKPNIGDTCYTNSSGWGCSGYILQNGNMDYLH